MRLKFPLSMHERATMPSDMLGAHLDRWTSEGEDLTRFAQRCLDRFTYKPGWHFGIVRRPEVGGCMLEVAMMAEDSRRGPRQIPSYREFTYTQGEPFRIERDDLIPIGGQWAVPPRLLQADDPEARFFDFLRATIQEVELHESDEWFRIDNVLVHDPHRTVVRKV